MFKVSSLLAVLFLLISWSTAQSFTEPIKLELADRLPQGTIYQGGDYCQMTWRFYDNDDVEVPASYIQEKFRGYILTITRIDQGKETVIKSENLPVEEIEYRWQLPKNKASSKYWLTLEAIGKGRTSVSGKMPVYAHPYQDSELTADAFGNAIRILMDWRGKRGFYRQMSPTQSFEYTLKACEWLRQNATPGEYGDYLQTIESIEATKVQTLTVFCPAERARLFIDGWLIGFFQEWDSENEKFYLQVQLPVRPKSTYEINIRHGKKHFLTQHTHYQSSEIIVRELLEVVYLTVTTPYTKSRIYLEGKNPPEFGNKHVLDLFARKIQVIVIEIENGPSLKLLLNPNYSQAMFIKKRENFYSLYQGDVIRDFVGNEISLLEFQ